MKYLQRLTCTKSIRNGCLNQLRHRDIRRKYYESLPEDWESEDYFMENVIKEEVADIVLKGDQ